MARRNPSKASAPGEAPDARLTVKAGDREVHLEARPEIVLAELDRVLDRLFRSGEGTDTDSSANDPADPGLVEVSVTAPRRRSPPPSSEPAAEASTAERRSALDFVTRARGSENVRPAAVELLRQAELDPATFRDLYSVDPGGKVCLRAMPATARPLEDLLLLLIYGCLALRGQPHATGGHLVAAARSLGLKLQRVPRNFGRGDDRVAITGRHRGRRYRLTTAGIRHCEALIGKLLASSSS